jgi:hypothetical protein
VIYHGGSPEAALQQANLDQAGQSLVDAGSNCSAGGQRMYGMSILVARL